MSGMNYNRDLDLSERDFFSSVGAVFSSIFSPIFPGQGDPTASSSSPSSTITLTSAISSAASATLTLTSTSPSTTALESTSSTLSSSVSSTSSSTSATSMSTSLTDTVLSTSDFVTATESDTTTSLVNIPASSPTDTSTIATGTGSLSATSASSISSSSPSSSAEANAASSPKGFLQNKALSVGVITACSLVGLVLIVVIATWAIRKRRRNKLQDEAVDFSPFPSSDRLLDNDLEDGGGGTGIPGDNRRSSRGSGSGESMQSITPVEQVPAGRGSRGAGAPPLPLREMYERTGYPALPVFIPSPAAAPTPPHGAYPGPSYANQAQGFSDLGPYPSYNMRANPNLNPEANRPNANAYQPNQSQPNAYQSNQPRPNAYQPDRPNPSFLQPMGNMDSQYGRAPTRRPSQRKQAPALPPLDVGATRAEINPPAYPGPAPAQSPLSAMSLSTPMQPASTVNPANLRASMEHNSAARRSSLLNSPVRLAYVMDAGESSRPAERDPQLPDQLGSVVRVSRDEKAALRQLTVRNE